ncbi:B12-binding domain-containing radical SAM protein [Lutispora saccharofermentans]|uniref:Radical SAM protein n=1 Tax=Lutispora saccharofermentans TaxID=3024236 RepID=A0ABT1NGD9_9FIRM|nr:radical SAM protein [Lutispora saccharofermentans]MCQ1530355.1 radical SAM protein [Lutispora saccharofermentans]
MKILLVRPPRIKQAITLSDFMFSEPLGLEMIYGVLKENHNVEIFDMMIETISLKDKIKLCSPEAVGITSLCIDVNKVLDLCIEVKNEDDQIHTIVGGTQAYLNSEAFFHDAVDHIFEYTNEENLIELYERLAQGSMRSKIDGIRSKEFGYASTRKKGRYAYMLPDRSSTEKYRREYSYFGYRPAAIMEFGVGCEKACDFCLRWRIEGYEEGLIDPELTKRDMAQIKEPTIMMMDNDFFASEEKVKAFLSLIRGMGIKKNFIVYGSVKGIILYKNAIKEFVECGLKAVLVGYETFKDTELADYRKKSTIEDNYKAAGILRELGVDVWASFMAHPDWDANDFSALRRYIKSLKPQITSISPLTPFPNLPMYKKYEDRLLYNAKDYEKWSFGQVMIRPSGMSLRRYYWELLVTNLYVNIFVNKKTEMIDRYGLMNIIRIFTGSLKAFNKYISLMIKN